MKSSIRLSLIATALVLAGGAYAQQTAAPAAELTVAQIVQKLEGLGYTAIEDIEKDDDDGVWEVEATAPSGKRVDLDIDPVDGRIIREKPDND